MPYYDLDYVDGMPTLPAGYLALFLPALIPPLWRWLMDERARQFAHPEAVDEMSSEPAFTL